MNDTYRVCERSVLFSSFSSRDIAPDCSSEENKRLNKRIKPGFLSQSLGLDLGLVPDTNFKALVSVLTLLENRLPWFWQKCLFLGLGLGNKARCLGIFREAVM